MNICRLNLLYQLLRSNQGQALAELMFAFAMSIMLLSGLVVAVQKGISNESYAQHKAQAILYVEEFMERAYASETNDLNTWDTSTSSSIVIQTRNGSDEYGRASSAPTAALLDDTVGTIAQRSTIYSVPYVVSYPLLGGTVYVVEVRWKEKQQDVSVSIVRETQNWR